jgi:endonuclease I
VTIELQSTNDVDIQLVDQVSATEIVAWPDGILNGSGQQTTTYQGTTIVYSGYNGDGTGLGNEFIRFDSTTSRTFTMKAFGYVSGDATVNYSWTGQTGCTDVPDPQGSGTFSQSIAQGATITVGDLPAGLTDVYVRLESTNDVDIELFDGSTAIIQWQTGVLQTASFATTAYGGVEVQYSGYNGEQRTGTLGQEYVFLKGTLDRTLTLKVLGYASGSATVNYSWGYYTEATSTTPSTLKTQLHNIIDGHTEISYSACWDALKRTDQHPTNPDDVILLYSRRSEAKANQDNGSGGDLWNREHVWPKSHGDFGTTLGPGSDIHALRAADASVNSDRNSKDFDNGGIALNGSGSAQDCPSCLETSDTFEPPDVVKGDVARMLFYMDVRYNGDTNSNNLDLELTNTVPSPFGSSSSSTLGRLGKLSTLLAWHAADPVSDEERKRNNLIYDIQGNRNPFIDNPQWVNIIF